ncbi:hypothetical protein [Dactylosporangium sp. CS-033363]|uniref:hypothetical protein n=1 Tax=Dactylosporangium sp. CS-033363 TaxID=3239935 RepID=UPI003D9386AB
MELTWLDGPTLDAVRNGLRAVSDAIGPLPDPTTHTEPVPAQFVTQYQRLTGTTVDLDRVMAWHLRTVLGNALWRTEAGVALPDGRTPAQWVDDPTGRFQATRDSALFATSRVTWQL